MTPTDDAESHSMARYAMPIIHETLATSSRATVYRGVRASDERPVIIKVLTPQYRPQHLARLKNEYEIGMTLNVPTVVRPIALENHQGKPALVMEDFGGEPLERMLGAPMEIGTFLRIAVQIVSAVADIHERHVVHKDLKPENVLVHPATGEVKITDFGIAAMLPCQSPESGRIGRIEGSLPYMAPEQTGRMNRAVDQRSDLYALGITFYQMLTGKLPFQAADPLEWVHCHIARSPVPPAEVVPSLPDIISSIVMKLLAKEADERYQSARGLQRDLARCLEDWTSRKVIAPFSLAERDISDRFHIPQKFYGREEESAALLGAFERVVDTGAPEVVFVSGYSGIGKTSLVGELQKPVVRERGFLASGKFDQYKRDIPYSTIVEAFTELVRQILAESEARITAWAELIEAALGVNGQLIVDVIPPVELIIGPQAPVPALAPLESQHRFRSVFRRFIGVFAQKQHPLALFLDDLQWADSGSLALLADLMTHPDTRHVLVIGAYRDNEVTASHPLMLALGEVRRGGARISNIVLGPLTREHLTMLVSDALHCSREEAMPLADLVNEKTGGNPFFVRQFLTALHDEHLIELDWDSGVFRWDVAKIRAKGFTDNVVDLMLGKLARLAARTQAALKQLACLGIVAEVASLVAAFGRSEQETHAGFEEAVRAGLVLRLDGSYRFLHDRVQEAAYSLIPEAERAAVHLQIGRLLCERASPDELEERIFEIVNHIDRGAALITSREERERSAELNLIAGKRAKRSTAYASALKYFAAGAALLESDCWERRYELSFALELHRAQCEYLTGDLSAAEERLAMLSRRAESLVDVAAVACARIALYTTLDRSDRGVEACLEYLRRVGVDWSPHPTNEEVEHEYDQLWKRLGSRQIEDLVDSPPATDPACCATMLVLTDGEAPALFTDENLHCLLVCRMANLSLEYGNSDSSCIAYVWLGVLLGPRFGDYRMGFRFGKLGLDLLERCGPLRLKARVYLGFGHRINPWTRHMRAGVELLRRGFDAAQQTGDLTFASYICNCLITLLLALGEPLDEVQRAAEDALEFTRTAKFGLIVDIITAQLRLIRTLRGLVPDFSCFDDEQFDEREFERHLEVDSRLAIATCWYWVRKLQGRFHADDYARAIEAASKAQRLLWTSPSFFEIAEYHFYGALARAAYFDAAPADERPHHWGALVAHHEQLEVWAESCPENFGNRAALVAAEIARIEGRTLDAERLYEQAIRSARENGFVHNEAIAYEVAARAWRARGLELVADTYLREASDRYARWGAEGKVRQLARLHPQLVDRSSLAATATFAVPCERFDALSVVKASQAISGEIVLDRLLSRLVQIVIEQAGAQKGYLILRREGNLAIEAEARLDDGGAVVVTLLRSVPALRSSLLPASIINYVARTKQRVLLPNGAATPRFASDEYIVQTRPKSILCLPILKQGELIGLFYLENDLVASAFTVDRLEILELLAAQAAISLESALLLAREHAARVAAEEAERRTALLAEVSVELGESLDYEQVLRRFACLSVREFADSLVIDIVEDGAIKRIAGMHADPAKQVLLDELATRFPPRLDGSLPASRVLRTGGPLLMPEITDVDVRGLCDDDEYARLVRALGTRTAVCVPLISRGRTIGAITLASAKPGRCYGRADLELAQELAHRAAIAIDNAHLHHQTLEALRLREEFLSVASHELRTPMTSLTLALQLMQESAPAAELSEPSTKSRLVELALRQGERLNRLIEDLLDVSRIETGELPLDLAEVDLAAVVRDAVDRFALNLARSRCSVSIHEDGHAVGLWDRSRLDQVVMNLLSNAVKFGAGKPIEIHVGEEAGLARLVVKDRGIGIEPVQQGRIFERFGRAVSAHHYGGLGLGLYISRSIIAAHGGSIHVASQPGVGSTFTIELPRGAAPDGGSEAG